MASTKGRHARKRSWFWMWFIGAVMLIWAAILGTARLTSHETSFQRAPDAIIKPEQIPHYRPQAQPSTGPAAAKEVTVTSGQTLWSLARQYCGNGTEDQKIAMENGIKGWVIQPGQKVEVTC